MMRLARHIVRLIRLAVLFTALFASAVHAATFVQSVTSEQFGDPLNVTISAVTSGNTVVVVFKVANSSQPIVSVTDNQSNSYTLDYSVQDQPNDGDWYVYRASNITNAPTQVSVDVTSTSLSAIGVFEINGLAASSTLGDAQTANANSDTPLVLLTTTTNNELGIAWMDFNAGRSVDPDSPWTEDQPYADPVFDTFITTPDLGAAGATSAGALLSSGVGWRISAVTYRAAAGASSGLLRRRRGH